MVKIFLPKKTAEKLQFFDLKKQRWAHRLLEVIPAEVLPIRYGGTNVEFG
jgi:hypothetical protein